MSYSAVDSLADALDATRAFLFSPIRPRRWLALAVLVLFAGSIGGGATPAGFGGADRSTREQPAEAPPVDEVRDAVAEHLDLILLAAAVLAVLWLAFLFVSAVAQLVFVESLRRESVDLRGYAREHFRTAIGLFGFEVGVGIVSVLPVLALGAVLYEPAVEGGPVPWALVVPLIVLAGLLGLVGALVQWFTRAFVVPTMLVRDCGALAGWRRFLPALAGSWLEYLLYAVVAFVVLAVFGGIAGVVVAIASVVLLIPVGILAVLAFLALGTSGAGAVVLGLLVLVALVLVLAISALVWVPIGTYLGYYGLFVLGDTDDEIDPIPDVRRRVRDEPQTGADPPA